VFLKKGGAMEFFCVAAEREMAGILEGERSLAM
jgi:hypothetical protein